MVVEKNILVKELTEHARVHQGSQEAGVTVWGQEQVCFLLLFFFFNIYLAALGLSCSMQNL